MRGGIQRRLTLVISLCVLLPLLLVWGIALFLSYRATEQSARQRQELLVNLVASDFSELIQRGESQLEVFGSSLVRATDLLEITNDRLYPILLSSQLFSEIGVYNNEGFLLASAMQQAPAQLPFSLTGSDILQTVNDNRVYYGGYDMAHHEPGQQAAGEETPVLRIALPVEGQNGSRIVVVGDLDLQRFRQLGDQFAAQTGAEILVVAADGHLVLGPEGIGSEEGSAQAQLAHFPPGVHVADYQSVTGVAVIGAHAEIEPVGWMLLMESSAEAIYADVRSLSYNLLAIIVLAIPLAIAVGRIAGGRIARPIRQLHAGVEGFGANAIDYRPLTINTNDELAALAQTFNLTAQRLVESRAELERSNERLEQQVSERTAALEQLLQELQDKTTTQEALLDTVRRLSLPVIPLMRGMVLMPLVGEITAERAGDLAPRLLHAVEQERARVVLLDISGVPVVDQVVAQALINTARAVRLIGAEAVLVGIRPEVSESLVSLDMPLQSMLTAATLEQGIALGLQRVSGKPANGRSSAAQKSEPISSETARKQ